MTLQPWEPNFQPLTAVISRLERRNCDSVLSHCKTFAYGQAVQARREATQQGCDDALLLNTRGELCCSTTANLLLKSGEEMGGPWRTPPLSSGCLPGVMRARALQQGLAVEAELGDRLGPDDQLLLINSLSCRGVLNLDQQCLKTQALAGESLWQALLK
ncbi:MAG: aminotransferase class IV [Cyanobacteriota bacterium]|nr:aminotransferase class IV [Cyanobacteriota bacterium]